MTRIEQFFARYEKGANNFDPALIRSQFAQCFMMADPNGAQCGQNDERFAAAIPQRQALFRQIGFQSARVLDIDETPLDGNYTMAKVHWHLVFDKDGKLLDFRFYCTYILYDAGGGPKVVFYLSHEDEQKVMGEAGLLPAEAAG